MDLILCCICDIDGDGVIDGFEINFGLDPLDSDYDDVGLFDEFEINTSRNAFSNKVEIRVVVAFADNTISHMGLTPISKIHIGTDTMENYFKGAIDYLLTFNIKLECTSFIPYEPTITMDSYIAFIDLTANTNNWLNEYNADIVIGLYDNLMWNCLGKATINPYDGPVVGRSMILFWGSDNKTLLHEFGHLQRAVPSSFPNYDGDNHCSDESCIMSTHASGSEYCSNCRIFLNQTNYYVRNLKIL